jgi:hypothetical protein
MPSPSELVAGLAEIANGNLGVAVAWHVLLGGAIATLLMGWRPSGKTAALLLAFLPASVSSFAFLYDNPFNGVAFGFLTVALLFDGSGAHAIQPRGSRAGTAIGVGLIALGWLYPHFLQGQSLFMYMFAAPTGLIPCPTLAVLTGFTVMYSGFSHRWSLALGAFGLFYGLFGTLRLGVWLDVGLLAGALYLLTTAKREGLFLRHRSGRQNQLPERARSSLAS